eukprot:scaffold4480_cov57-Phaeocystis_antarctica.AAC.4
MSSAASGRSSGASRRSAPPAAASRCAAPHSWHEAQPLRKARAQQVCPLSHLPGHPSQRAICTRRPHPR